MQSTPSNQPKEQHHSLALKTLQEDAGLFLTMADIAPVMLWMAGLDKGCYYFNQGWLQYTGSTLEEQKGNLWADWVHDDDLTACMDTYCAAFDRREPFRMEYRLRRHDGVYRWILDSGAPWYKPDGTFAGYIGSCIDIDDQVELALNLERRVEERTLELAQMAEALVKSNVELQHFAHIAAHDLREPLRTIVSYTNLLAKELKGKLSQDAEENISYIVDAGQRMQQLITDLLTYSRLDTGTKKFDLINTQIIFDQTVASLKATIEDAGAVVTSDPLPDVLADASQISQVYLNLLGNALKFVSAKPPQIHAGVKREGNEWVFSIKDNGIGIDPKFAERVFQMFQRLHPLGEYTGTGMGLAICKRIVDRHGGRIWVESTPDQGCQFFFSMPVERAQ